MECIVCLSSEDGENIVGCQQCGSGAHVYCGNPEVLNVASWTCADCISQKSTGKTQAAPVITSLPTQHSALAFSPTAREIYIPSPPPTSNSFDLTSEPIELESPKPGFESPDSEPTRRKKRRQQKPKIEEDTMKPEELFDNGKRYSQRKRNKPVKVLYDALSAKETAELHSAMKNSVVDIKKVDFSDIPDAPVFRPTAEQFRNPIAYIKSIRGIAEQYGICKIIPPTGWSPPLALDQENFTFGTRQQPIHRLTEASGFDNGKEYKLPEYRKMAGQFASDWFRRHPPGRSPSTSPVKMEYDWDRDPTHEEIESEYWRLVETASEPVTVEYGNDIDSGSRGSGFERLSREEVLAMRHAHDEQDSYAGCPDWNLNVLPFHEHSLLRKLSDDIPGVNIPWVYVGMLFSSFCWHTEDDHLYSINYMHTGEPKRWYGIPGKSAVLFEKALKLTVPGLFEHEPDLLFKLVTMVTPRLLLARGVPICKTFQEVGNFIVTYPRAYHAGFNLGFNIAEAVNFATDDWFSLGREALMRYRKHSRGNVFSHEKLLLSAILNPEQQDAYAPTMVSDYLLRMKDEESKQREFCRLSGMKFEKTPGSIWDLAGTKDHLSENDLEQCRLCKHFCFLSYLECSNCGPPPKHTRASAGALTGGRMRITGSVKGQAAARTRMGMVTDLAGRNPGSGSGGGPGTEEKAEAVLVDPAESNSEDDGVVRRVWCLEHAKYRCRCSIESFTVKYRFEMDDFETLLRLLNIRDEKQRAAVIRSRRS